MSSKSPPASRKPRPSSKARAGADGHRTRTTSLAALQASLSRFLARVKIGEEVLVTERGRPIARIVPVSVPSPEGLEDLIRAGVVRPPRQRLDPSCWEEPLPKDSSASVRRALIAERREGR